MRFLLEPLCRGVVCASVHLLREPVHMGLTYVTNRWAWSPLVVKVTSVAYSSEWFITLSTPRMILGTVHEQPSLHLLDGINSRVSGVGSLTLVIHNLL
jgi:hypothetical protein